MPCERWAWIGGAAYLVIGVAWTWSRWRGASPWDNAFVAWCCIVTWPVFAIAEAARWVTERAERWL